MDHNRRRKRRKSDNPPGLSRCGRPAPRSTNVKLTMVVVIGVLTLGLIVSLFIPKSPRKSAGKKPATYSERLDFARNKVREGKRIIRQADVAGSGRDKNSLLKKGEDVLWKAREVYGELLENHQGNGYEYLEKEASKLQSLIYHCQKNRTL